MSQIRRGRWNGGWMLAALALGLNLLFIAADLPIVTHPDEPRIVRHAVAMGTGDLNPHFFYYPTLWIYVVFLGVGLVAAIGLLFGWIGGRDQLAAMIFTDPTLYFVTARVLTALAGAAAVWMAWRLGRRFSPLCGWTSALSLMLFGSFVWQAHHATVDVPLTLAVLVCLDACATRAVGPQTSRGYWWPAIAAGLAASIKYTGVLALGSVFVMLLVGGRTEAIGALPSGTAAPSGLSPRQLLHRALVAAGLCALAFLATSPFVLVSFRLFVQHAGTVARGLPVSEGVDPGPLGYLKFAAGQQGWPLIALALVGWGLLLLDGRRGSAPGTALGRERGAIAATIVGFLLPYLVLIDLYHYRTPRTFLPLVPAIGIGAGLALERLRGVLSLRRRAVSHLIPTLLLALCLIPAARGTIEALRDLAAPSADRLTIEWFTRHVPPQTRVIVDGGTWVTLPPDSQTVLTRLDAWRRDGSPIARQLDRAYTEYLKTDLPRTGYRLVPTDSLLFNTFQSGQLLSRDYDLARLQGVQYVVLSERALHLDDGSQRAAFFTEVRRDFDPVYRVTDRRGVGRVVMVRKSGS